MRFTKATVALGVFGIVPLLLAATTTFFDIEGHRYAASINLLANRGVVSGYSDGTFRPGTPINRAEFLKILIDARYAHVPTPEDLQCFTDLVTRVPQWYSRSVCIGRMFGIVGGYPDGTFKPDRPVNLAEALKMALNAFDIPVAKTATNTPWYEQYVLAARQRGILIALLTTPDHQLTRGEMAEITATLLAETQSPDSPRPGTGANAVCGNGKLESTEQCDDGNTENSDGCSKICIIVPEPVRIATILIDTDAAGTITNQSRGQENVTFLRFTATAGRQDAILKGVTFAPTVGSLTFAQHYTLAMDRNGDGIYEAVAQAEGKAQGDRLIFNDLAGGGIRLFQGLPIKFEVRADLASTLGPVTLGLQFSTSESDYIRAIGAIDGIVVSGIETDSVCPSDVSVCFIRVHTRTATQVDVQ